jgi:hypothetical protein
MVIPTAGADYNGGLLSAVPTTAEPVTTGSSGANREPPDAHQHKRWKVSVAVGAASVLIMVIAFVAGITYKRGSRPIHADTLHGQQAGSYGQEKAAELTGKDLLAWKLAYEAAGHEAASKAAEFVAGMVRISHKLDVLPDTPSRHLMAKTPTGDYRFAFGMELHQFHDGKDDCLLGILLITVSDFGASMRSTKAEGGFFPLSDSKALADYVGLFGETEGVRADGRAGPPNVGSAATSTPAAAAHSVEEPLPATAPCFAYKSFKSSIDFHMILPYPNIGHTTLTQVQQGKLRKDCSALVESLKGKPIHVEGTVRDVGDPNGILTANAGLTRLMPLPSVVKTLILLNDVGIGIEIPMDDAGRWNRGDTVLCDGIISQSISYWQGYAGGEMSWFLNISPTRLMRNKEDATPSSATVVSQPPASGGSGNHPSSVRPVRPRQPPASGGSDIVTARSSSGNGAAKWEGKVVSARGSPRVYFVHKGIRYWVDNWGDVEPFGLSAAKLQWVNPTELEALPEGPKIMSVEDMKRCLAQ